METYPFAYKWKKSDQLSLCPTESQWFSQARISRPTTGNVCEAKQVLCKWDIGIHDSAKIFAFSQSWMLLNECIRATYFLIQRSNKQLRDNLCCPEFKLFNWQLLIQRSCPSLGMLSRSLVTRTKQLPRFPMPMSQPEIRFPFPWPWPHVGCLQD